MGAEADELAARRRPRPPSRRRRRGRTNVLQRRRTNLRKEHDQHRGIIDAHQEAVEGSSRVLEKTLRANLGLMYHLPAKKEKKKFAKVSADMLGFD